MKASNKNIEISLLLPIFNGEDYLLRCLQSLNAQNLSNCEVLILNDSSTDNTLDILTKFKFKIRRNIKIFYSKKNRGYYRSLKILLKLSAGEYYLILGHDDALSNDYLYKLKKSKAFENKFEIITTSQYHIFDTDKKKLSFHLTKGEYTNYFFFKNFFKLSLGNIYVGLIKKSFIPLKNYLALENDIFKTGFLNDHRSLVFSFSKQKNAKFYFYENTNFYKGIKINQSTNINEYGSKMNIFEYYYSLMLGLLPLLSSKVQIFRWTYILKLNFLRCSISYLLKNICSKNIILFEIPRLFPASTIPGFIV